MTLLAVEGLTVELGGRTRLDGLSFTLAAGEVLGLVGESGSGKSLTALALARLLPPGAAARGRVCLDGTELLDADAAALGRLRGRRLGLVFQEPATALNPLMSIGAQVAETVAVHERVTRRAALARAAAALERVGLEPHEVPPGRFPHELSGGQRQRVAIALAIVLGPRLLIADEPTTALDVTTQAGVLELLGGLVRDDGMGLLLVSHDLAVVAGLAHRVAILRGGRLVECGPTAALLGAPADPYTRALLADFRLPPAPPAAPARGAPLLEAEQLVRSYPGPRRFLRPAPRRRVLDGVSLAIGAGERVGLVGESGTGKSTLVRLLLGLDRADAGEVRVAGERFAPGADRRALRRQVQAVFQDPYGSLDPRHDVARIVAEPLHLAEPPLSRAERALRVARVLAEVGLPAAAAARRPREFSGGERQRIALARALIVDPRLVVLDEAVSALDASVRARVLALLDGLSRARGLAYLFVSHDLAVLRAVTDRVLVMHGGRIVEEGPTAGVLETPRHPYTQALVAAAPSLERALGAAPIPGTSR